MGRVVVDVMLKPEILDPQGQAVAGALPRLGFTGFTSVRQGKRFELEVEGEVTDAVLAQVREAAATLLSNPVIEDVVRVAEAPGDGPGAGSGGGSDPDATGAVA
jgi:phosphoribosylformylglycinamidine synthase subunit PurS